MTDMKTGQMKTIDSFVDNSIIGPPQLNAKMSKTKSQWAPKDQTQSSFNKAPNFNTISNFSPKMRLPVNNNQNERSQASNLSSCHDYNALDDTDKSSLKSRLLKEL
jgi:hypothetical protein